MCKFKVGDKVRCIKGYDNHFLRTGDIYTIFSSGEDNSVEYVTLEDDERRGWYASKFELLKPIDTVTFIVREWDEWVADIIKRVGKQVKSSFDDPNNYLGDVTLEELILSPKLDPIDPQPFCKSHVFANIYENNVFVKDHKEPNCYWYISGEDTKLIYKPALPTN